MGDRPVKAQSAERKLAAARPLSRRRFIQTGLAALGAWLVGCRSAPSPGITPSAAPTPPPPADGPGPAPPTGVAAPADTPPAPGSEPPPDRAALMAHWPATSSSRVVLVRHGGVWVAGEPDPTVVLQMLDAGLAALTDLADTLSVWRTLFDSGETVLLKVNCFTSGGPTQPAVAYAVAQRLQDAGLRPEQVLIFDRSDDDLAAAGYALNDGGPAVQCHGSRNIGSPVYLSQGQVHLYAELEACDAIVNLPTPKQHEMAGISVALKNHYGSIDDPGALHRDWCDPAIAELNAHPVLRDKTRLIVAAALRITTDDWESPQREDALLLSFDPVALDTVARDLLVRRRQELGLGTGYLVEGARHLRTAQSLGLGATDSGLIDLRELTLG